MNRPTYRIKRATAADATVVAYLIGDAFHDLAVAEWLIPDPTLRTQVLPANFRIFVDHALAHGEVHLTADGYAAAVWFPRDGDPLPEPVCYQERLERACGKAADRFRHLDALFDTHHPTKPHHHLAFLAVDPGRQGAGRGSALLNHHHFRLDARGIDAYLEATSPRSRDLYIRHGYQVWDMFRLPDGTPIWSMWRPGLETRVMGDQTRPRAPAQRRIKDLR